MMNTQPAYSALSTLTVCAVLIASTTASAAATPSDVYHAGSATPQTFYVGADYLATVYDEPDLDGLDLPVVRLRGGIKLHPNFALELVAGTGLSDDSASFANDEVSARSTLEVDTLFGGYAKVQLPLRMVTFYGLLGFTDVEFQAQTDYTCLAGGRCEPICPDVGDTCVRVSNQGSEFDFSYGAGLALHLSPHWSLNADWIRYVDEYYELGGAAAGIRYDF